MQEKDDTKIIKSKWKRKSNLTYISLIHKLENGEGNTAKELGPKLEE